MIEYIQINENEAELVRELCDDLMKFQKCKAKISQELFDDMSFDTRLLSSIKNANKNFILLAKDDENVIGYVYCNVSNKEAYDTDFATFFDLQSVENEVGCLSQFYIVDGYRDKGVGTNLFNGGIEWLKTQQVKDWFIYVSNGNDDALKFYVNKGFHISHTILSGFITVLRN